MIPNETEPLKTVQALDALPDGSVILDSTGRSVAIKEPRGWWVTGEGAIQHSAWLLNEYSFLPATILHVPNV